MGLELAEFLGERGRIVTVLEPTRDLGVELSIVRRWRVLHNLAHFGVELIKEAQIDSIDSKYVHYTLNDEQRGIASDTVVMATGIAADRSLADILTQAGHNVQVIGDSHAVGYIEGALDTGYRAGLSC